MKTKAPEKWSLRLYVAGMTPATHGAIENLERILGQHLGRGFSLEVVDLVEHPALAEREQILATPTLVRSSPAPLRKIVGDFSNTEKVLSGLDLHPETHRNL